MVRDTSSLDSISRRLEAKGDGEVTVVAQLQDGIEVDVKLPGRFKLSPQIAGAIKAIAGVVQVEAI
jgi:DNA polymerase-3 subunit alpha